MLNFSGRSMSPELYKYCVECLPNEKCIPVSDET